MATTLRFTALDLLRCRFAVSPLWEALAAVRALREDRGRHAPWLAGLDVPALRRTFALLLLLQPRKGYVPDFLTPPPTSASTTIEQELARVRATSAAVVRRELGRSLGQQSGPVAVDVLAHPVATRDRLAALQEQAWQLLVEPYWARLARLLEDDVVHHAAQLARDGLAAVLVSLHRDMAWRGSELVLQGLPDEGRELGGEGLVLVPSAFSWPTACVLTDPAYSPMLVYPCRGVAALWAQRLPAPDTLSRLLGRGRAAVLTALANPASTTQLSVGLQLSPSTVSEHLTALREAGLLHRRRSGHQVRYARTSLGDALVGSAA